MPQVYLIKVTTEDTHEIEVFITGQDSNNIEVLARKHLLNEYSDIYTEEDTFELYANITDYLCNGYKVKAIIA